MATNGEDGTSRCVGNQRVRRKDAKVVKKASVREKSGKRPWEFLPADNNISSDAPFVSVRPHESVLRRLGPYVEVWQDKYHVIVDLYTAAKTAQFSDESAVQRVCNLATELIESTAATLIELEIYGFIAVHLFPTYFLRCQLHFFQLEDYRGAIEDASDALTLYYSSDENFRTELIGFGT
jgi:hypothetical protein